MSGWEQTRVEDSTQAARPWGFWATVGLSVVIGAVYFGVMALWVLGIFLFESTDRSVLESLTYDGFVVFSSLAVAGLAGVAVTLFLAGLRKGLSVRDYLCLRPVSARVFVAWFGIVVVALGAFHLLSLVVEPQNVTSMYRKLYETSIHPAVFWIAVVVVAPLFEEILFRGFLFRGIEASRLGARGAIVITAAIWSVIHSQYDAFLIGYIFVLGVVFGVARARQRSLYLTIALHAVVNLMASIEILLAGLEI